MDSINTEKANSKIKAAFETLFESKQYSLKGYFSNEVWFLIPMGGPKVLLDNATPTEGSDVVDIIKLLSRGSTSKLKVSVSEFISAITDYVVNCAMEEQMALKVIEQWNADEKKNLIEETIAVINDKDSQSSGNYSTIKFYLESAGNLPKGQFYVELETFAFTTEFARNGNNKVVVDIPRERAVVIIDETSGFLGEHEIEIVVQDNDDEIEGFNGSSLNAFRLKVFDLNGITIGRTERKEFNAIFTAMIDDLLLVQRRFLVQHVTTSFSTKSLTTDFNVRLDFNLTDDLRSEIMKKVHKTFCKPLELRSKYSKKLEFICEQVFPELSEKIEHATADIMDARGACCECSLF